MQRIAIWCLLTFLFSGCGASKDEHMGLTVVNRSSADLELITVFDDNAKEGRRVMNVVRGGRATIYPLGLQLRERMSVTVLKGKDEWFESRFTLGTFRTQKGRDGDLVVCVEDTKISLGIGQDWDSASVFEEARMERAVGPPTR